MARTMPVHAGYSILNGIGTGPRGDRVQVWVEYLVKDADANRNRTWLTAYAYAALDPNYTASAYDHAGLHSTFSVDGKTVDSITDGAYDFSSAASLTFLGSFDGWIEHNNDGPKGVALEVRFTTTSPTITGGNVTGVVTLPAIARGAKPLAEDILLGRACRVSWVPSLISHSFTLTFSVGDWQSTTPRIHPNTSRAYTFTDFVLPLDAARQFPGVAGTMTVVLSTYEGDTLVGQASDSFTVTVPENQQTRPVVSAVLTPESAVFPGVYVQQLSKVQAQVTAEDPLGAEITQYSISTGGRSVNGTLSDYLYQSGQVSVIITARNSRGFTGTWQGQVQVHPYGPPRILRAAAYRCLPEGTADPGGQHLRLEADWSYSPVEEQNTCHFRWRYQAAGEGWSEWETISNTNSVDTGALAGVVSGSNKAYTVQMEAVDAAGGTAREEFSIPVEKVYMHRTKDAMGLGGYAREADTLEVHWALHARKSINGAYIRTVAATAAGSVTLQSRFASMDGTGDQYQAILLFGSAGGRLIQGFVSLSDNGNVRWEGTEGVTAAADTATGILTVTLPCAVADRFTFISPDPIG